MRIAAVSLGIGIGTAMAAELTVTPTPLPYGAISDAELVGSSWRYFDPGFLVDHLPFRLTIAQTISYSDNVANQPRNLNTVIGTSGPSRLPSRGDFYSDTTLSLASRFPQGAQTFFFNFTYAPRQYFTDTALDANNLSVNGGVDFNVADRCSGQLTGGLDQSQTSLEQTVGLGVQEVTSISFNEVASCKITGHINSLFNSGVSQVENSGGELSNSLLSSALNSYQQYYVAGGLQYGLSGLDTLSGIFTFTHRDFTNRSESTLGLARSTDQQDVALSYNRIFSPRLSGTVSGGFGLFQIPGTSNDTVEPNYSLRLNYLVTPKISISGTFAQTSGAPQSAISDLQTTQVESISLSYRYSSKLSVSSVYSHSKSNNPVLSNLINADALLFANSTSDNASVILNYQASPLLTATAAYSFVDRADTSRQGADAISNVFRVGLVYTR